MIAKSLAALLQGAAAMTGTRGTDHGTAAA